MRLSTPAARQCTSIYAELPWPPVVRSIVGIAIGARVRGLHRGALELLKADVEHRQGPA